MFVFCGWCLLFCFSFSFVNAIVMAFVLWCFDRLLSFLFFFFFNPPALFFPTFSFWVFCDFYARDVGVHSTLCFVVFFGKCVRSFFVFFVFYCVCVCCLLFFSSRFYVFHFVCVCVRVLCLSPGRPEGIARWCWRVRVHRLQRRQQVRALIAPRNATASGYFIFMLMVSYVLHFNSRRQSFVFFLPIMA